MLKIVDRVLIGVLFFGACGHAMGSFKAYGDQPMTLLWSLCGSLYVVMLGALHVLRQFRSGDRPLAAILCFGSLAWVAASVQFGMLIGNPLDFRPVIFYVVCLGLAAFSARQALQA